MDAIIDFVVKVLTHPHTPYITGTAIVLLSAQWLLIRRDEIRSWKIQVVNCLAARGVRRDVARQLVERDYGFFDVDLDQSAYRVAEGIYGVRIMLKKWRKEDFEDNKVPSIEDLPVRLHVIEGI